MKFILGVVVGVLLVALVVFAYFATGMAPVATAAPAMPFEKRLAKMALRLQVEREMPKNVPIPVNDVNMMAGANIYIDHCAVCHGLPDHPQTPIAAGMFPKPPQLFTGKGVTNDPAGESYWKVTNGIRLTGMPAFKQSLTDNQIWQVSILLANADKMEQSTREMLKNAKPAVSAAPSAQK